MFQYYHNLSSIKKRKKKKSRFLRNDILKQDSNIKGENSSHSERKLLEIHPNDLSGIICNMHHITFPVIRC